MPGFYPDYGTREGMYGEDRGGRKTLGAVLKGRADAALDAPTNEEVLQHYNIQRPILNSMADLEEWSRRMSRLKQNMVRERLGASLVPRVAPDRYRVG